MAGAPTGNQNAKKLTTPELKEEAYLKYCEWLARGKSWKSFTFQKDDLKVTGETVRKYLEEDPIVFAPIHRQFAWAQGYAHWEQIVEDSAVGINKEANTASLQMLMRNKYDWDKPSAEQTTHHAHVVELAKGIRSESLPETETSNKDVQ